MNTGGGARGGNTARILFLTSFATVVALFFGFFGGVGLGVHQGGDLRPDGLVASVTSTAPAIALLFGGSLRRRDRDGGLEGASHPRKLLLRNGDFAELNDPKSTEARTGRRADLDEYMDPRSIALRLKHVQEMENDLLRCDKQRKWWQEGQTRLVTVPEFYETKDGCWHDFLQDVTFFHIGKGGGGTVDYELKLNRFLVSVSHPSPKSLHIEKLQQGPLSTLIVNVRDPVDRFVSAFKWVLVQYCDPGDPRGMCTPKRIEQESEGVLLLREKYNSNPTLIAEALCEDSSSREEASENYFRVGHSRTLMSWFQFMIDPSMRNDILQDGVKKLIVVPMEKRGDTSLLEQYTQELMLELLGIRYGRVRAAEILAQRPQKDDARAHKMLHSTSRANSPALSPLGECCLTRHLRDDYRLIQTMLGGDDTGAAVDPLIEPLAHAHPLFNEACSWGGEQQRELCRSDLRSIISRRARYLDWSAGTCAQLVATVVNN